MSNLYVQPSYDHPDHDWHVLPAAVFGASGVLGSAIMQRESKVFAADYRLDDEPYGAFWQSRVAYLCAGTKGFAECEGNRAAFRADVDGNIRLARHLLKQGTFVLFVSTDAVEWALHTAYARNRFMVELAIGSQPNVAIVRPSKFSAETVGPLADLCVKIGTERLEGLHYWWPR